MKLKIISEDKLLEMGYDKDFGTKLEIAQAQLNADQEVVDRLEKEAQEKVREINTLWQGILKDAMAVKREEITEMFGEMEKVIATLFISPTYFTESEQWQALRAKWLGEE